MPRVRGKGADQLPVASVDTTGLPRVLGHRRNRKVKQEKREDFASGYEFRVWTDIKKRGVRVEYEPLTFEYERRASGGRCKDCGSRNIIKVARYTPDFRLNGYFLVETKGKYDASARSRMDDFVRSRPDIPVAMLFGADNWTTRTKTERYSGWCTKRGITFAVGDRIPESWIKNEEK
jgi:hypothetical protein